MNLTTTILSILKDKYIFLLLIYTFIMLFFCSQFSYLFGDFNGWADINIYYTIGKSLWFDMVPYKDLFDHKGPLIFFIYAFGYKITPDSFQGMFIFQLLFLFVSLFFVYRLCCLFLSKILSFFSACIFLTCLLHFNSYGGSAEEFVLVFMVISLYFFIKQFKNNNITDMPSYYMLVHGILLSATFFIKFNLVIFWFFPLLAILISLILSKDYKLLCSYILMFLSGVLIVTLPIFIYFIFNNALSDFIESYFRANYIYGSVNKLDIRVFLARAVIISYKFSIYSLFIFWGVIYFSFSKILKNNFYRVSILLSFVFVLIAVFISSLFFDYYLVVCIVFIPLSIISTVLVISHFFPSRVKYLTVFSLFIVLIFSYISVKNKDFFGYSLENIRSRNFDLGSFEVFSEIISEDNDLNKSLIGMPLEVSLIFTRAKIVPYHKYFFCPNFSPDQYPIIYDCMSNYIKDHTVKYIVLNDNFVFLGSFYDQLINNSYKPISTVGIYTLYKYSE